MSTKAKAAAPQTSPSRTWTVPVLVTLDDGRQVPNEALAQNAMVELSGILQRLGGVASIAAIRRDLPEQGIPGQGGLPARVETELLQIRWQQYVPKAPAAPAPEPVAVANGNGDTE